MLNLFVEESTPQGTEAYAHACANAYIHVVGTMPMNQGVCQGLVLRPTRGGEDEERSAEKLLG
jgi:hypothetical protein